MSCTAKVRVTLEIEFDLDQPWCSDETIGNMQKRAFSNAQDMAERLGRRAIDPDIQSVGLMHSCKVVALGSAITLVLPEPDKL